MDELGIHCYGCPAVVTVDSRAPEQGLQAAGWSLVHGETYCPVCARAQGLSTLGQPTGSPLGDPGSDIAPPPSSASAPPTASVEPAAHSRELALLDTLEERARRYLILGAMATALGVLLFAGLSTSPVAVAVAAVVVVGAPLSQFWDDRTERRTKQAIGILLAVMAFWLVLQPLSNGWGAADLGRILRWVLLLFGPLYIWAGLSAPRYLPAARSSLSQPTYDALLEIDILRGYGGIPYTQARLWPSDTALLPGAGQVASPLAQFRWQASEPQLVAVEKAPAKVHGAPTKGAVVVVSCPEAVLVGRVKRSHFGEPPSPPRAMSPVMAWLWKPRSLRLR